MAGKHMVDCVFDHDNIIFDNNFRDKFPLIRFHRIYCRVVMVRNKIQTLQILGSAELFHPFPIYMPPFFRQRDQLDAYRFDNSFQTGKA